MVSTDESLITCIWRSDSVPLSVLPSPFSSDPSPTISSGVWALGGEKKDEMFFFSFVENGVERFGTMVEKGELLKEEEKELPFVPLSFCHVGEDVWVGGKKGEMATIPLSWEEGEGKRGKRGEIWQTHGGESVNDLVVVGSGGESVHVWSCGGDGCIFVWKEGGGGLVNKLEHPLRRGIEGIVSCEGVVCYFIYLFFLFFSICFLIFFLTNIFL